VRPDGSSLSLSTDGTNALLVFVNSLEESFHSVGDGDEDAPAMVFDYFGSWSEAPAASLVPLAAALECVQAYAATGSPDTPRVLFEAH
jgi:hypothetical protein